MSEYNPFVPREDQSATEFNPYFGDTQVDKGIAQTSFGKERKKDLIPLNTPHSREVVTEAVEVGNDASLIEETKGSAMIAEGIRARERFQDSFENQEDPEAAILRISEEMAGNPFIGNYIDPTVMATVLTGDNELAKKNYLEKFQKVLILHDKMMEKMDSAKEDNWFGTTLEVLDSLSMAVPVYGVVQANQNRDMANRISQLVTSNLTPEEFSEEIDSLLTEAADTGLFSDENSLLLNDFYSLLDEGGEGTAGAGQQFWTWFDTLTAATGLVRSGARRVSGQAAREMGEIAKDTSTLISRSGRGKEEVKEVLGKEVLKDDPTKAATDVANKGPSSETPLSKRQTHLSAPEATALREIEEESQLLKTMVRATTGEAIDEKLFSDFRKTYLAARREAAEQTGSKQVFDNDVYMDDLENIYYEEMWGTNKGNYYRSSTRAQQLADSVGGEVVEVGKNRFAVRKTWNIPLVTKGGNTVEDLALFAGTNADELGYGFWAKWGSPLSQTTDRLNAILKQDEAIRAQFIDNADKQIRRGVKGISKAQKRGIERVFNNLRDGDDAGRTTAYNAQEFKNRYTTLNGRRPTDKETELYLMIQERNDVAFFLKADIEFKDQVAKGVEVLTQGGLQQKAIKVNRDSIPDNDLVWDFDKKQLVFKSDITDKKIVYSMADDAFETPVGEKVQFVVSREPKTRRLYHSDVMGYNPGGPRVYADNSVNFFVKQQRKTTLASGREVQSSPRTFLGVKVQKEAEAAVSQINEILKAARAKLPKSQADDVGSLRQLKNDPELLAVIGRNTEWNPNITTVDEFADFVQDTGLSLRDDVRSASDGQVLSEDGTNFLPGIATGKSIAESFMIQSMNRGGRKNNVLLGYGGAPNKTEPSIASINKGFTQAIMSRTEANYVAASVNGLLKGLLQNPEKTLRRPLNNELVGLPIKAKLRKLKDYINTDTLEGKKFALERDKIEWRLKKRPDYAIALEQWKKELANDLYSAGNKRSAAVVDWLSGDPVAALRGYVFDFWLGLFAWDQLMVQGSQMLNVSAIAGIQGVQGSALTMPTRFFLQNGNRKVLERGAELIAPVVGVKPAQYIEMIDMLKENGRLVTGLSVTELGEDAAYTGLLSNAREKGRFFFNEGETLARISAHQAAYLEYIKKFPDSPANSQAGRRWIAHRQDVLTQGMTSASRSPYQQAPGLQFLTYSWRISEALFAGTFDNSRKVITGTEKAKLFTTHMLTYGAAGGVGSGYALDRIYYKYGSEVDEDYYKAMRFGMLDVILSETIGVDTALSSRLGWGEGLSQTFMDVMDKGFIEAVAGPSGNFGGDALGLTMNLIKNITTNPEPQVLQQDLTLLARQVKSVNMAYDVYTAQKIGAFLSRNGTGILDDDVTVHETVARAFGIPLADYVKSYRLNDMMYKDSEYEKSVGKKIERMFVQYSLSIKEGEFEDADLWGNQIALILQSLPGPQRERVLNSMPRKMQSYLDETLEWAIKRDYNVGKTE